MARCRLVTVHVGNGGFSLRRNLACIALIEEFPEMHQLFVETLKTARPGMLHEDFFFSTAGSQSLNFKIPNERVASTFALEALPEVYFKANEGRCAACDTCAVVNPCVVT